MIVLECLTIMSDISTLKRRTPCLIVENQSIYKTINTWFRAHIWFDAAFSYWGMPRTPKFGFLSREKGMSLKMPAETEMTAGLSVAQSVSKVKKVRTGMGIELSKDLDQYIEFDYLMTDPGTVEFWFKPYWNGDEGGTFRLFDANNAVVFFSMGKGAVIGERENEFHFAVEDAPDTDYYLAAQAADVVKKDQWMHLAATWDFGGSAYFYIDGEEVATAKGFAGFPAFHESPRIGGNNKFKYRATTSGAHGVIDEFAIYS